MGFNWAFKGLNGAAKCKFGGEGEGLLSEEPEDAKCIILSCATRFVWTLAVICKYKQMFSSHE
jgi:hypothetical protein